MTSTKLPKIVVIVGPTTSHKTHLAIEIANKFNGEIINAEAPMAKMFGFSTSLRSVTQVRASFTLTFSHFEIKSDAKM